MPRPRLPDSKAKALGSAIKNPQRFRDREEPGSPELGGPSGCFHEKLEIDLWYQFKRELPWLSEGDRTLVEAAVRLRADLYRGKISVGALNTLRLCVSAMGGTPVDRSRIGERKKEDAKDPAAEFFN